ncbi:hypothetical protein LCGC14_1840480 [marine sediment metagenome]|uniref:Uncharacterized protein n=1 Tax=marine sediment metagenome TaxID=412755 RepID=A0A0F9GDJ4_9ZZZZ
MFATFQGIEKEYIIIQKKIICSTKFKQQEIRRIRETSIKIKENDRIRDEKSMAACFLY